MSRQLHRVILSRIQNSSLLGTHVSKSQARRKKKRKKKTNEINKLSLFLLYLHALTILDEPTSDSPNLCSPSCSLCTSTCSHHSSTQTSPPVARQSSNFLYDCMALFQRHLLLHPCLFLRPCTSVLSFSTSSLQYRYRLLKIPLYKSKTKGDHAFSYFDPLVWNTLPLHIRNVQV